MERRILTELFVEDEKSIKEDLGTIDYVEREAGWMSESGIRVGRMRILDDDDPEDAKASDLTDKIFNSEEDKLNFVYDFVYVVKIDITFDGSTNTETKVFSTREKAKVYFDECVADEKANSHLMELDNKVVDDYENYFSVYQEGFWSENRYEIEIIEKVVH